MLFSIILIPGLIPADTIPDGNFVWRPLRYNVVYTLYSLDVKFKRKEKHNFLFACFNKECYHFITIFYFVRALQTILPSGVLPAGMILYNIIFFAKGFSILFDNFNV